MSTIYVAGPMRGLPKFNFPTFDEVSAVLRRQGHTVINPADHDRAVAERNGTPPPEKCDGYETGDLAAYHVAMETTFEELLGWDLVAIIRECDEIVLLQGWENSEGASHEKYVAEATGKLVRYAYKTPQGHWVFPTNDYHAFRRENTVTISDAGGRGGGGGQTIIQGHQYATQDSGVREEYASGMVRDTVAGKPRYDLIPTAPLKRLAELYARGAEKYGECNWQLANSADEHRRFRASALRHAQQWLEGDESEDHAIAVVWNIFAFLWLEEKIGKLTEYGSEQTPEQPDEARWQPFYPGDIVAYAESTGVTAPLRGKVVVSGIERTTVMWDDCGERNEYTDQLKKA